MKKFSIFLFFCLFVSATFTVFAATKALNLDKWYQFNSSNPLHSFSLKFPNDWQIKSLDDKTELLLPKGSTKEEQGVTVREFSDQSYDSVINYFTSTDQSLTENKDIFVTAQDEDLLGKQASYKQKSSGNIEIITFFKRGSSVVTISSQNSKINNIYTAIINSFEFNDKWSSYIDDENKFSFIYPKDFILDNKTNEVNVKPNSGANTIFTIAKTQGAKPKITYADQSAYKNYSLEMTDSFSFFDLELKGKIHTYQNFPDVTDLNPNAKAINYLYKDGIIKGYGDGNFKPDGEVTRAELTKMIVSALASPGLNDFNGCFPDVQKEWFAPYICYAKTHNWISGLKDGKFHPNDKVNRVEAIKIIISGFFNGKFAPEGLKNTFVSDVKVSEWYGKYFIFADNRDLLDKQHIIKKGSSYSYLPLKNITRKEVAETIFRIKNLH